MKKYHSSFFQIAAFAAALAISSSIVSAEEGTLDQLLSLQANLHSKLQDYVNQSIKGVAEAMQEGPPRDPTQPFTLADLQQIQAKHAAAVKGLTALANLQQKLLDNAAKILAKLPANDPRRAGPTADMKQIGGQLPATRESLKQFSGRLVTATAAVNRWRAAHESGYVPPKDDKAETAASSPAPSKGGGLAELKNLEKNLQRLVNELSKVREAAVNKYLEDPSPYNKRQAEQIKEQLVKLVNKLNDTRHKVDELEGTSRPDVTIKTAREIASLAGREAGRAGSEAGRQGARPQRPSMPEGHHHGPGGY